jgi:hypothetical protein
MRKTMNECCTIACLDRAKGVKEGDGSLSYTVDNLLQPHWCIPPTLETHLIDIMGLNDPIHA